MNYNGKMSYKDFVFPVNPRSVHISTGRKVAVSEVPSGNDVVSDLGNGAAVISGEGEFYGSSAAEVFAQLRRVMTSGGCGMLYIPSQKPICAVAKKLDFTADDTEGLIRYSFVFVESFEKAVPDTGRMMYGDGKSSLWDISYKTGIDIDPLVRMNVHIKRPDIPIKAWEKVYLC